MIWEPDKMNIHDYLKTLGSMDIIISGRAHGLIIGALLGVIPVSLGISQKLIEVSKYFQRGGALIHYPFTTERILETVQTIIKDYTQFQKDLNQEVEQQKKLVLTAREAVF
jgi:polysaccharide pyruvyl transferase WcaK-like protein